MVPAVCRTWIISQEFLNVATFFNLLTWIPGLVILLHLTGKPLKICVHSLNLCLLSPDSGHWDLAVNNQCKVPALTKLTFQWVKTNSKVYSTLGDSVWQRVIMQRWGKGEQRWEGLLLYLAVKEGRPLSEETFVEDIKKARDQVLHL